MIYSSPEQLTSDHLLTEFDCGEPALNEWLSRKALANHFSGASRTWVVTTTGSHSVVAFYASATASLLREATPRAPSYNQPNQIPAVFLCRMGVDQKHQEQGLGAGLLKHFMLKAFEVSQLIGIRLVLAHAKDRQAGEFYQHYGFIESTVDPLTLLMRI